MAKTSSRRLIRSLAIALLPCVVVLNCRRMFQQCIIHIKHRHYRTEEMCMTRVECDCATRSCAVSDGRCTDREGEVRMYDYVASHVVVYM